MPAKADYEAGKGKPPASGTNSRTERLAHQIVVSAAQGDFRKISILLSLMEKLEDAKTEKVSDAESSFSLSQGKSQGKNENPMSELAK